jgi:hypothetical protein
MGNDLWYHSDLARSDFWPKKAMPGAALKERMRSYSMVFRALLLLVVAAFLSTSARANDFSFTGAFAFDNDVQFFSFRVSSLSSVTIRTLSYAGGVDALGQPVFGGGFDPILALFDTFGAKIYENDDGIGVPVDLSTGRAADALLEVLLGAGDYLAALSQYDNFAGSTLTDRFLRAADGNFTPLIFPCFATQFCDASGAARTGTWAIDITGVDDAARIVPEPASLWMCAMGLLWVAGIAFRRAYPIV